MRGLSAVNIKLFFSAAPYAVEPQFKVRHLLAVKGYLFAWVLVGFVLKSDAVKEKEAQAGLLHYSSELGNPKQKPGWH